MNLKLTPYGTSISREGSDTEWIVPTGIVVEIHHRGQYFDCDINELVDAMRERIDKQIEANRERERARKRAEGKR